MRRCCPPNSSPLHLRAARSADDAAAPDVDGFLHPLSAAYRIAGALPQVESLLAADRLRKGTGVLERIRTRAVDEAALRAVDPLLASLRNVNTPDEYRAALRAAGFAE